MPNPPGRCIFCKGFGLCKEHLFSDWLRELFPRAAEDSHSIGDTDSGKWVVTQKQGHSGSKKIRTVCRRCNNEWMNHIDDAAKYVATPLIRDEGSLLTREMQAALALWFSKVAMVADSRNRKRSVVTQAQRDYLMARREPPEEWDVWIASYGGGEWRDLGLFQHGGHLDFTPIRGPGEKLVGYAETTFIGMGKLVALVIADDLPLVDFNVGTFARIARRIWPLGDEFRWPLPNVLSDEGAHSAAHILNSMLAHFRE